MDTPAVTTPATEGTDALARFAHRVATRDEPVPPPPHGYDQDSLEAHIARALRAAHPAMRARRALTHARVCYALMLQPRLITRDLAAAAFTTRLTVYNAFPELRQLGLAADEYQGGRRYHFLTRAGEDWLLEVTR
ncbi:hypothetical protein [Hymenobacter algoricola]